VLPRGAVYVRRHRILSLALFMAASGILAAAVVLDWAEAGRAGAAAVAGLWTLFALISLARQRAVVIDVERRLLMTFERHAWRGLERRVWPLEHVGVRLEPRAAGGPRPGRIWILVPDEPPVLFTRGWGSLRGVADRLAADLGRPLAAIEAPRLAAS